MKRLIHKQRVPYGGLYELSSPKSGFVGSGFNFYAIEASVLKYRRANGIPVGIGFQDELETLLCEKYPDECKETDPKIPGKPERLRLGDVILGTRVMIAFVVSGMKVVPDTEAERRAQICSACKYNVPFSKPCGGGCGELKDIVRRIVGNRKTSVEEKLNSCHVCHCYLTAAVWIPAEIQIKPLSDDKKSQFEKIAHCWKKQSLLTNTKNI